MAETFDPVTRPQHYADKKIETIDYLEDTLTPAQFQGYCLGNILKYMSRYRLKGGVEDIRKSDYYTHRMLGSIEKHGVQS